MSSLTDWSNEREKCWASQTTFIYPTGQMTIEFRTYLFEHNCGINYVKKLLKLSNKENRAVMLQTVEVFADEIKTEYRHVMDGAERKFDEIDNKYLFEMDRENAKKPIRKKRDARRKSLNNTYNKLLKIKSEIEGWK